MNKIFCSVLQDRFSSPYVNRTVRGQIEHACWPSRQHTQPELKSEYRVSATTMDVDAVEEAFLRGEWGVALSQSKEQLARSIVEVRQLALPALL